jgi:hypothetical protein
LTLKEASVTNNIVQFPSLIHSLSKDDKDDVFELLYLDRGAATNLEITRYMTPVGYIDDDGDCDTYESFEETYLNAGSELSRPPGEGWIFHDKTNEKSIFRRQGRHRLKFTNFDLPDGRKFSEIVLDCRWWGETTWPHESIFIREEGGRRYFRCWEDGSSGDLRELISVKGVRSRWQPA